MDDALRLLNILREAVDDAEIVGLQAISVPGESDPGEFYLTLNKVDYVVRLEEI